MSNPSNLFAYLTYAWRCFDRLVFVLIACPASAFSLVALAFFGRLLPRWPVAPVQRGGIEQ